jgi:thiamine pyrophosphate-dependent acetolactate synthase large subunit-like protein
MQSRGGGHLGTPAEHNPIRRQDPEGSRGGQREEESVMAQGTTDTTRCIDRPGIKVDNVRHEQVAAHSADGYARMEATYGSDRGRIGNTLGDVPSDQFAKMLGGYGEEVRDPKDIAPALRRARESGLPSLINVWVDPGVYAPGTMNQAMYK